MRTCAREVGAEIPIRRRGEGSIGLRTHHLGASTAAESIPVGDLEVQLTWRALGVHAQRALQTGAHSGGPTTSLPARLRDRASMPWGRAEGSAPLSPPRPPTHTPDTQEQRS